MEKNSNLIFPFFVHSGIGSSLNLSFQQKIEFFIRQFFLSFLYFPKKNLLRNFK
jgi:hypothetical protein